ncbi:carboxypeptidase S [Spirochaetia bacterium]|nr:carboxypeptidase S [Spirochaetia bacterium]
MTVVLIVLAVVLLTVVVVFARTFAFKPPASPPKVPPYDPGEAAPEVLERLSKAIAIPTVSAQNYADTNFAPFDEFITFLQKSYPLFHKTTELTRINTYALVFRWKGTDPSLEPVMLTAHYDVVPVEAGTEGDWKYPAFSGEVAEGRVWGRGALDIKSQLTAHLEAAESLMKTGFVPTHDLYFVYGQDEEVGGVNGAAKAAEYFAEKGIRFQGVLDEGGIVVSNAIKGVKSSLALIGLGEKGFCNYKLTFDSEGGHSSMPLPHTALGNAAKLLTIIEEHPLPTRLTPPVLLMIRNIAGEMGFAVRMAAANLWLFRPVLLKILSKNPSTNALIRTTFAVTMAKASDAPNVLPQKAEAVVNVRLLSGDTTDSVAAHFRHIGGGLPFKLEKLTPTEPSAISPASGAVYEKLAKTIAEIYPNALASPYLVMGGTDSRKYYGVCDNIYRFTPVLVNNDEKNTMHGTNESISIANYGRMIRFFVRFIEMV